MKDKIPGKIIENFKQIIMKPFEFNGVEICVKDVNGNRGSKKQAGGVRVHNCFEFIYVTEDSAYISINSENYIVGEGESVLIPPHTKHSYRHDEAGNGSICIYFDINIIDKNKDAVRLASALSVPQKYSDNTFMNYFISSIDQGEMQLRFLMLIMKLYYIATESKNNQYDSSNRSDEINNEENQENQENMENKKRMISGEVISYMKEHYMEKIYMNDVAAHLNTTYRTLSRKFKKETGMTLIDMLTDIRIEAAKSLLLNTDKSVSEIAYESGYENEFYFSAMFKNREGCSPMTFRTKSDFR